MKNDIYTKSTLTIIAINLTAVVGYGAAKGFIPDAFASGLQRVYVAGGAMRVSICSTDGSRCAAVAGISTGGNPEVDALIVGNIIER